jgi:transcriptional regulator with XRE-family HTH domain
MSAMSVRAVGGYIQGLIDSHGDLTAAAVAERAGVKSNYIWRLKTGDIQEPSAKIIGLLVRAARGSVERAMELLLRDGATEEDGHAAATTPMFQLSDRHQAVLSQMTEEELDALVAFVARTRRAPPTNR